MRQPNGILGKTVEQTITLHREVTVKTLVRVISFIAMLSIAVLRNNREKERDFLVDL